MDLDALTAISPIDGRYRDRTRGFARWFSEQALMNYRLRVELDYFTFLCLSLIHISEPTRPY